MTSLQQQARALGDPTRFGVFRYLVEAGRGVDVAELTTHFSLNHNAIRQHLAKLVAAGLVVEAVGEPTGRGRPPLRYRVDPTAESRWDVVGPYERLSLWLAEVIRTGDPPIEVGRRIGRRQRLGVGPGIGAVDELVAGMAGHGFEPAVHRSGGTTDITLRACPFVSTALADPDIICALHLGIAEGMAESLDGLVVDELVPKDPRQAHCRLRCHVTEAT